MNLPHLLGLHSPRDLFPRYLCSQQQLRRRLILGYPVLHMYCHRLDHLERRTQTDMYLLRVVSRPLARP